MREIRCFVSSPGDVGQERVVALRVIERLAGEYSERLRLTPIVWEHEPLRATEHFQSQIVPPSQTDIVICILWSRLGTRLPEQFQRKDGTRYESGTEWEFENAIESYRQRGTPDLLVYRKTSEAMASLKSKEMLLAQVDQKEALDKFIDRWFGNPTEGFRAAFHNFQSADEFERLLEAHLRRFLEEHVGSTVDLGTGPRRATWHRGTPFRGLKPFDVEHAPVFYGRTKAISELKNQLTRQAAKGSAFVLVIGMSGSGKSSLVRAGLLPTLIVPGVVEGVGLWRWAIIRPNDAPGSLPAMLGLALHQPTALPGLSELGFNAKQLSELFGTAPHLVTEPIGAALKNLARQVAEQERLPRPPTAKWLLVIDQLEEIFAQGKYSDGELRNFAHAITVLAQSGYVWILATLRSDYFSQLSRVPEWIGLKAGDGQFDLLPPTISEIEQMIQFPARAAGLAFEVDSQSNISLDKMMLESAAESPEALPLLEFTLDELYKRREDDVLTFGAYRQLGGLEGAIAQRAEEVLSSLPTDVQKELPHLFRACVTVAPTGDRAVSAVRVPLSLAAANQQARQLVDAFLEARLLVADRDSQETQVIGLAHEALLRHWPRLTQWLADNREFFRIRSQVSVAAETWNGSGRSQDYLLSPGKPLVDGESLLESKGQLSPLVIDFVRESSHHARRRTLLRNTLIVSIAAAFGILITAFGIYSFAQWRNADRLKLLAEAERADADRQRARADEQRNLAQDREQDAIARQKEAEDARARESAALELEKATREEKEKALEQVQIALQKADFNLGFRNALIADVYWSQNEMTSARSRLEQTPSEMRHWEWNHVNRKCNQETFSRNLGRKPKCISMSPQGIRLAVSLYDDSNDVLNPEPPTIQIWDWVTGTLVCELNGALLPAEDVQLIGKGERAVSWGGNELLVWNVDEQSIERRIEIDEPEIGVLSAAGSFAAFGYRLGTFEKPSYVIEVWDIASGEKRSEWTRDGQLGQAIAISPDGSKVVVAQHYSGIVVFEHDKSELIFEMVEPEFASLHSTIFCMSFSDDQKSVAVGRYNGDLQIYSLDGSQRVQTLFGHENAIANVCFGFGQKIISSGWDAAIHVWNLETGQEVSIQRGHESWVVGAAVSASGNTLVSVSKDAQLKVWDLRRESSHTLYYHHASDYVEGVAWSPNSKKWLAAVDGDSLINGELATSYTFNDGSSGGEFLARAPDGSIYATSGGRQSPEKVLLYSGVSEKRFSGNSELAGELNGNLAAVNCAVFLSPERLATGAADGTILIWDVATSEPRVTVSCSAPVLALSFDASQNLIYAGAGDGQVVSVDAGNGELRPVTTLPGPIGALALRPQSSILAIAVNDPDEAGRIALIDLVNQQISANLVGHTDVVRSLDFAPDGSRLASGSDDRSIKIWDVDVQLEALSLWGHQREITSLAFDPTGNKLASGDRMGTIIIWDGTPPNSPASVAPSQ